MNQLQQSAMDRAGETGEIVFASGRRAAPSEPCESVPAGQVYWHNPQTGEVLGNAAARAAAVDTSRWTRVVLPAPAGGWLPIETMPKDGVLSLFCDMRATELRHSFFVDWMVAGKFCGDRQHKATHWMPLPAAPTTTQSKEPKE